MNPILTSTLSFSKLFSEDSINDLGISAEEMNTLKEVIGETGLNEQDFSLLESGLQETVKEAFSSHSFKIKHSSFLNRNSYLFPKIKYAATLEMPEPVSPGVRQVIERFFEQSQTGNPQIIEIQQKEELEDKSAISDIEQNLVSGENGEEKKSSLDKFKKLVEKLLKVFTPKKVLKILLKMGISMGVIMLLCNAFPGLAALGVFKIIRLIPVLLALKKKGRKYLPFAIGAAAATFIPGLMGSGSSIAGLFSSLLDADPGVMDELSIAAGDAALTGNIDGLADAGEAFTTDIGFDPSEGIESELTSEPEITPMAEEDVQTLIEDIREGNEYTIEQVNTLMTSATDAQKQEIADLIGNEVSDRLPHNQIQTLIDQMADGEQYTSEQVSSLLNHPNISELQQQQIQEIVQNNPDILSKLPQTEFHVNELSPTETQELITSLEEVKEVTNDGELLAKVDNDIKTLENMPVRSQEELSEIITDARQQGVPGQSQPSPEDIKNQILSQRKRR